jgi:hypothetical protein
VDNIFGIDLRKLKVGSPVRVCVGESYVAVQIAEIPSDLWHGRYRVQRADKSTFIIEADDIATLIDPRMIR